VRDLNDDGFQPSKAATLHEDDHSEMVARFLDTTEYLRQSLQLEFSDKVLCRAAGEALLDVNSLDWEQDHNSESWDEDTEAVRLYNLYAESDRLRDWRGKLPRLVQEILDEARADVVTVLSWFEWAESYRSEVERRKKNGSGFASLPEPPNWTECSDPIDLSENHAGISSVARKRRQQRRRNTSTASSGITQRTITKGRKKTTKSGRRGKPTRSGACSDKFSRQLNELSEQFTGMGWPSASAASSSREKDGQDTDMELE